MSVFTMKLLAVLSMLIDHTGFFLRQKYHIGNALYALMRSLGRFAFPVYCFLIVNGFEKSSDRKRYLTRLTAFAAISQIPFSLVFSAANYTGTASAGFSLLYPPALFIPLLLLVSFCWYSSVRSDATALLPAAALLAGISSFGTGGVYVLYPHMNIFYTLAVSLALICFCEGLTEQGRDGRRRNVLRLLGLCAAMLLIRDRADYGYYGILPVFLLWLTRSDRKAQGLALLGWCAFEYLCVKSNTGYFIAAALSVIPLMLYSGMPGRPFKKVFYIFYPAHLLILGLLAVFI